jgi:ABC-type nickel/cobalt efflux system permease component RcnA
MRQEYFDGAKAEREQKNLEEERKKLEDEKKRLQSGKKQLERRKKAEQQQKVVIESLRKKHAEEISLLSFLLGLVFIGAPVAVIGVLPFILSFDTLITGIVLVFLISIGIAFILAVAIYY